MKEDIVSFELAKLLKEIGFNWKTHTYYDDMGESTANLFKAECKDRNTLCKSIGLISAPTLSLAQRWFREIHNIDIEPRLSNQKVKSYYFSIQSYDKNLLFRKELAHTNRRFSSYEKALEAGLLEACKILKEKQQ